MATVQEQRQRVVAEALSWADPPTPYHHRAAVKGVGVDCAQILIEVYHACGLVPRVDVGAYSAQWHLHRGEEVYLGWLQRHATPTTQPQAGDVAVWRFGRTYSHAGILVAADEVVHALRDARAVVRTRLHEAPLARRPVKFFTLFPTPAGVAEA